jgi:hypothetical protein
VICENAAMTDAHPRRSSLGVILGLGVGLLIGGAIIER